VFKKIALVNLLKYRGYFYIMLGGTDVEDLYIVLLRFLFSFTFQTLTSIKKFIDYTLIVC